MAVDLSDDAIALLQVVHPRTGAARTPTSRLDNHDLTELAALKDLPGAEETVVKAAHETDLQDDARLARRLDDPAALVHGHGHRLFQEHVLAGGGCSAGHLAMQECGRDNHHRVDIALSDRLAVVGIDLPHAQLLAYRADRKS